MPSPGWSAREVARRLMGYLLVAAVQGEETAAGTGFRLPQPGPCQPPAGTPLIPSGQS